MWVSLVAQLVKNQAGNVGGTRDRVGSLGQEPTAVFLTGKCYGQQSLAGTAREVAKSRT